MTNGAGVFYVVVHVRARVAINITTRSNAEWKIPPGAVFATCPSEAGRGWRDGLVEPLGDIATDADFAAFQALRRGFEAEALDDLRRQGGQRFRTARGDYATEIQRASQPLPPARPVVLNLGGTESGDSPLARMPDAFG